MLNTKKKRTVAYGVSKLYLRVLEEIAFLIVAIEYPYTFISLTIVPVIIMIYVTYRNREKI